MPDLPYYSVHVGAVIDAAVSAVAPGAAGDVLLSGPTPAWGKADLATHTTGALAMARGGVPTGGTAGQALTKATSSDYNLSWASVVVPTAGRGVVLNGGEVHFAQNSDYTVGLIPYSTSTTAIGFESTFKLEPTQKALHIGATTTAPNLGLWVLRSNTVTEGSSWGINCSLSASHPGASSGIYRAAEFLCQGATSNNHNITGSVVGVFAQGRNLAAGFYTLVQGAIGVVRQDGTGTTTTGIGVEGQVNTIAGIVTAGTAVLAASARSGGTLTTIYGFRHTHSGNAETLYGLYLTEPSGTITNRWGVYQLGATTTNYLAGRLGLGINTFPTMAGVGLAIGNITTAPSTAPASGGMLFVEDGALKYVGSGGTVTLLGDA